MFEDVDIFVLVFRSLNQVFDAFDKLVFFLKFADDYVCYGLVKLDRFLRFVELSRGANWKTLEGTL